MKNNAAVALVLSLTALLSPVFADEESNPPRHVLETAYARQVTALETSSEVAIVYHAARLALMLGRYEDAARWLSALQETGWKLGIDTSSFDQASMPLELRAQITDVQAALPNYTQGGTVVFEFDDPHLFPESIGFDPETNTLFAGSLLAPRLIKNDLVDDHSSGDSDLPLPDGDWGVIYGIKFHSERSELWVLHNRTTEDGMQGRLSVVTAEGELVKHYATAGGPAVELNDLCFRGDRVFVTDSTASRIYHGHLDGAVLSVHYEHSDIRYPNGIACSDDTSRIFVAHARGTAALAPVDPQHHTPVVAPAGYSLGGIDGLYLWRGHLVGVQNYLGAPKILRAKLSGAGTVGGVSFHDVLHPAFHIPTTGFIEGDCLYYIANSSLDLLPDNGELRDDVEISRAKILALNLADTQRRCAL